MENTRKGATKSKSTIDNEPKSPTTLNLNATTSNMKEALLMTHLLSLQETINKEGCVEIRALMRKI